MRTKIVLAIGFLMSAVVPFHTVRAATLHVSCGSTDSEELSSIGGAIKRLSRIGPNTIIVTGACMENVVILDLDRLTISAQQGASISDASAGNDYVISINRSRDISIIGFAVTGGVVCGDNSMCTFSGNTVQNANGDGVLVSNGSGADFSGDVLKNSTGRGLVVQFAAHVLMNGAMISSNGIPGGSANIRMRNHASLVLRNSTVQGGDYYGIRLTDHSTLESRDNVITGNKSGGVSLESSSEGSFDPGVTGSTITANNGGGVLVYDVSFANFIGTFETGTTVKDTITGNGSQDVFCSGSHAFANGLANLGATTTTNCTAP